MTRDGTAPERLYVRVERASDGGWHVEPVRVLDDEKLAS